MLLITDKTSIFVWWFFLLCSLKSLISDCYSRPRTGAQAAPPLSRVPAVRGFPLLPGLHLLASTSTSTSKLHLLARPAQQQPRRPQRAQRRACAPFLGLSSCYYVIYNYIYSDLYPFQTTVLNKKAWLYGTQSVLQCKYHESMTGSWKFKTPINITFGQKRPPAAACIESLAGKPHVKPKLD